MEWAVYWANVQLTRRSDLQYSNILYHSGSADDPNVRQPSLTNVFCQTVDYWIIKNPEISENLNFHKLPSLVKKKTQHNIMLTSYHYERRYLVPKHDYR